MSNVSSHVYSCPVCNGRSFGFATKVWSSPVLPVRCAACGAMCFAPRSPGGVLLVTNSLLLLGAGIGAVYWHSFVPILLGGIFAAALWASRLHLQPLVSLSPEQSSRARSREGLGFLALVLYGLLQ